MAVHKKRPFRPFLIKIGSQKEMLCQRIFLCLPLPSLLPPPLPSFPPPLPSFPPSDLSFPPLLSPPPFTLPSLSFPFSSLTFASTLPFQSSVGSISNSDTQVHCVASFWYLLETTNISISAGILWNLLKDNLLKAFDLENGKGKEIARFLEVFEIKGFG